MIVYSVPPGYRRAAPVKRPKLDGFTDIIDQWLRDDVGMMSVVPGSNVTQPSVFSNGCGTSTVLRAATRS